jgi:hypothetical protein
MLPDEAVRQKMTVDGFFSKQQIDDYFNGDIEAVVASQPLQAIVNKKKLVVYDKMRTMLPDEAVRQKMTVDGFFSKEQIDDYFSV